MNTDSSKLSEKHSSSLLILLLLLNWLFCFAVILVMHYFIPNVYTLPLSEILKKGCQKEKDWKNAIKKGVIM